MHRIWHLWGDLTYAFFRWLPDWLHRVGLERWHYGSDGRCWCGRFIQHGGFGGVW